MNLDNVIKTQPTVQVTRQMTTTNGCKVSMTFPARENPSIQRDVAEMLLAAFAKRRSVSYETGTVPVQSFNQRSSR